MIQKTADDFLLLDVFRGYYTKSDKTKTLINYLVSGSQNVLINDEDKIEVRDGYTLLGAASTATTDIESAFTWHTSTGGEIKIRSYDDELEIYTSTLAAWEKLKDGWSAVDFIYDTWWDNTEKIDKLLFVNGDNNIYEWSGGITTFASATANTITKQGTGSWAASRFLTAGTRQIRVKDSGGTWRTFTYTGGETTTALTGVTPDPTGFTFAAGASIFQEVRTNSNVPVSANYSNDWIKVLNNQLYVGSTTSRLVYVSKNSDFSVFTYSTPRVPGEGALLTLDDITRGFAKQDKFMYISSGRNDWYRTEFDQLDVAGTLTETLNVKKLKTGLNQAAQSQRFIVEMGDFVGFLTFEPAFRMLGNIENLQEPGLKSLSNPIKPDFDAATFTGGMAFYHKNRIFISAPGDDVIYILEIREDADGNRKMFWQPPQVIPVAMFSTFSGNLYGHSNAAAETYRLFNGTSDNGNGFLAKAAFAYRNFGTRTKLKVFNEYFSEGYISANTQLKLTLNYDFDGFSQILERFIDGKDSDILFQPSSSGSLGDNPLGDSPLGDQPATENQLPKFKIIHTIPKQDFFELQAVYETDAKDSQWEIMAHGPKVELSTNQPIKIKKST